MSEETSKAFEGWAILELMGRRRLFGLLTEETIAGAPFLRIDVPDAGPDNPAFCQFYSGQAIYCITPCSEEVARGMAGRNRPAPVQRFELPAAEPTKARCPECGADVGPDGKCSAHCGWLDGPEEEF